MSRSKRDAMASALTRRTFGPSGRHQQEHERGQDRRRDEPKPDQGKGVTRSGQYRGWRAE